ncbi:ethanolamine ammonia-lyase light chain [Marinobacterium zhoushanense]|uniref:Ethanolamine ammonia-lyase small subunit n=1 Tax=Marinobacterium zhoushanense TaxID=1679163 RepID=A0ABQ1K5Z3_9GAMM|nr:ethanolamine ammonia-lyase subunit EutC [Marinobacterium zhoushanense]GGB85280.1 ethanolamine ammonia-lyase light chain [Marinobacterium zhoushanense]
MTEKSSIVTENPWASLKRHTNARIGLGRVGISQPTDKQLAFQLSHALARDAVHIPLDLMRLAGELIDAGLEVIALHSRAGDRQTYLKRPDFGRRLDGDSAARLKTFAEGETASDACIVIADGLSSTAVQSHAGEMARRVDSALKAEGLSVGPVCIVEQGRVAIGDEIGELLGARLLVLLVGERPGLSSPDSLGIYYTYGPRVGLTDAARNCISNVRPAGLPLAESCERLMWLIRESQRRKLSGVTLKDESGDADALDGTGSRNFLLE